MFVDLDVAGFIPGWEVPTSDSHLEDSPAKEPVSERFPGGRRQVTKGGPGVRVPGPFYGSEA